MDATKPAIRATAPMLGPMLLHPRYVLRVAGEPAGLSASVETGGCARLLDEIEALRGDVRRRARPLCEMIEQAVPTLGEPRLIRSALEVKRAFFQLSGAKLAALATLTAALAADAAAEVVAFDAELVRLSALERDVKAAYDAEIEAGARALERGLEAPNLVSGLSYSNPELFDQLQRKLPSSSERPAAGKTRRNLEDSLFQYLVRCSTKTSPLSTFTVSHVGRWGRGPGAILLPPLAGALQRRVEMKGAVFQFVLAPLFGDFATASALFPLKINESSTVREGRVRLRVRSAGNLASGRFWGAGESISDMADSAILRCIEHALVQDGSASLPATELCRRVCALAPKLPPEAVWRFFEELFTVGWLVPDHGSFDQQDALAWASSVAERLAPDLRRECLEMIGGLQSLLVGFAGDAPGARAEHARAIRNLVGRFAALFRASLPPVIARPNFFENCYIDDAGARADIPALEPFARPLELLLQLSPLLDFSQEARCYLADFFLHRFGADGRCTDVTALLDDYDEVYGPGVVGHAIDRDRAVPHSPQTLGLLHAKQALDDHLEPLLRGGDDAALDPVHLRAIRDLVPPEIMRRSLSYSYLVQAAASDGEPRLVVNQIFGGRSSLVSLFLEAVDEAGLEDVRSYVRNGADSGRTAEVAGAFGFNANHHPRLTDAEVTFPPFPPNRAETRHHPITSLALVYDAATHSVRFETALGERLDVFYQGFLIPSLLPRLQRIVALSFTEGPANFALNTLVSRGIFTAGACTAVPRLSMGGLVLSRRQWIVPPEQVTDANLPHKDFFVAARRWAQRLGLPSAVFVRAIPIPGHGGGKNGVEAIEWQNFDFKDMKPFYVHFDSPRLVRLFQRQIKRTGYSLSVTEALPQVGEGAVEWNGAKHVAELQFELTLPAPAEAAAARWHLIRIAYFDENRSALLLGPVAAVIDMLRNDFGLAGATIQTNWKFGPHVALGVHCDPALMHAVLLPAIRTIVEPWLAEHPSGRSLDPENYALLSSRIGMAELTPGPYLPLLVDNSVTLGPYVPSHTLKLAEIAESKQRFLLASTEILLDLLRLKRDASSDTFLLALVAMMASAADTYEAAGMAKGYVSYRSHAEYFFAGYDADGRMRGKFDALDDRLAPRIDEVVSCLRRDAWDAMPFDAAVKAMLAAWRQVIRRTAEDILRIVEANHEELMRDDTFETTADVMRKQMPTDYTERFASREMSELGRQFEQDEGVQLRRSAGFMAYRTTINFFYLLLPTLAVSPSQKFCLCHLVANGVERVYRVSWRDIMGLQPVVAAP